MSRRLVILVVNIIGGGLILLLVFPYIVSETDVGSQLPLIYLVGGIFILVTVSVGQWLRMKREEIEEKEAQR